MGRSQGHRNRSSSHNHSSSHKNRDIVYGSVNMAPSGSHSQSQQSVRMERLGKWSDIGQSGTPSTTHGGGTTSHSDAGSTKHNTHTVHNKDVDHNDNHDNHSNHDSHSDSSHDSFRSLPDAPPLTVSSETSFGTNSTGSDGDESSSLVDMMAKKKKGKNASSAPLNKRVDIDKSLQKRFEYKQLTMMLQDNDTVNVNHHKSSVSDDVESDQSSEFSIHSFDLFQSPQERTHGNGGGGGGNGAGKLPFYVEAEELHRTTGRHKQKRDKERAARERERERQRREDHGYGYGGTGGGGSSVSSSCARRGSSSARRQHERRALKRAQNNNQTTPGGGGGGGSVASRSGDSAVSHALTMTTYNSATDLNFGKLGVPHSASLSMTIPAPQDPLLLFANINGNGSSRGGGGMNSPIFFPPGGGPVTPSLLSPGATTPKSPPALADDAHSSDASDNDDDDDNENKDHDIESGKRLLAEQNRKRLANMSCCERRCCPQMGKTKRLVLIVVALVSITLVLGAIAVTSVIVFGGKFWEDQNKNNNNSIPEVAAQSVGPPGDDNGDDEDVYVGSTGVVFVEVVYNQDPLRMDELRDILLAYGRRPMPFGNGNSNDNNVEATTTQQNHNNATNNVLDLGAEEDSDAGADNVDAVAKGAANGNTRLLTGTRRRILQASSTEGETTVSAAVVKVDLTLPLTGNTAGGAAVPVNGTAVNVDVEQLELELELEPPFDENVNIIVGKVIVVPNETVFDDPSTHEYKALEWLSDYDPLQVDFTLLDNVHWLAQRYSARLLLNQMFQDQNGLLLETLDYAVGQVHTHFVNLSHHECDWFTNTTVTQMKNNRLVNPSFLGANGTAESESWQSSEAQVAAPVNTVDDIMALWDSAVDPEEKQDSESVSVVVLPKFMVACNAQFNITSLALCKSYMKWNGMEWSTVLYCMTTLLRYGCLYDSRLVLSSISFHLTPPLLPHLLDATYCMTCTILCTAQWALRHRRRIMMERCHLFWPKRLRTFRNCPP
jgi:hypothetical protein